MLAYFDLNKHAPKSLKTAAISEKNNLTLIEQLTMYLGILIGVLFSSAVDNLKNGDPITLSFNPSTLIISAVIALVIIPIVYQKLGLNREAPFIVQFGLFVQNGVFWQVLVSSLGAII